LQNRYRLISVLGQGGFGRTYLAEDQGRFNELCALKEWISPQSEADILAKSQELFQREAAVLYQIQHPQIPQFRAIFEQDGRLFLVQDYVAGATYRTLLEERQRRQAQFSEAEVRQLIENLLPVLDYIHGRGMIHRDISPENIILREKDWLPVLIDFGVVKELATRLQVTGTYPATTVGKLGYAPSEQIQTGRAYPSSDLYALAVTAIVLLTGREPQESFDDRTLTWQWQTLASVRPSFAHVLNRMLSQKPSDRYTSAAEVARVLQSVPAGVQPAVSRSVSRSQSGATVSQMKTVAVGGRSAAPREPAYHQSLAQAETLDKLLSQPRSFWENPWALIPTGIIVALLSGFGAWAVVNIWLGNPLLQSRSSTQSSPPQTPLPTLTPNPPVLNSKPAIPQSVQHRQLNLVVDQPIAREGTITSPFIYQFAAEQGQMLSVQVEGADVQMTLLRPNQEPVADRSVGVKQWEGSLPVTGEYMLRISPTPEATQSDYKLQITLTNPPQPTPTPTAIPTPTETPIAEIEPLSPSPSPAVSPSATLSPDINVTPEVAPTPDASASPINSSLGGESIVSNGKPIRVSGQTSGQQPKRYLINGRPEKRLKLEVLAGAVTLEIVDPTGQVLDTGVIDWNNTLLRNGTYEVRVLADQPTDFTLKIKIND
jgi:serine/threonine-protein kinase